MRGALDMLSVNNELLMLVLAVLVVVLVWTIVLFVRVSRLMKRRNSVLTDSRTGDIVDAIEALITRADGTDSELRSLRSELNRQDAVLQTSIKHVGAIRFDAFEDVGGEQSFAVALLDSQGNGVVLSVIYARQDSRVYAKPIKAAKSDRTLSTEEQRAIDAAMSSGATAAR